MKSANYEKQIIEQTPYVKSNQPQIYKQILSKTCDLNRMKNLSKFLQQFVSRNKQKRKNNNNNNLESLTTKKKEFKKMNYPNEALIEEPYIFIKVISGFNLVRSARERKETVENRPKDSSTTEYQLSHQESNQSNLNEDQFDYQKQDTNKENIDSSNSFLKVRNNQNESHPFNISVSVHTPTTHLFETQSQKTFDGTIKFDKGESRCQKQYNQLFTKEKTQSLNDIGQTNPFIMHRRWKSSQPPNQISTEKKIFLQNLSKYIMIDVMDSDCYMEKVLMNTQVIPVEFFSIPINAGKKWNIWLRMNKYSDDQSLAQEQLSSNPELKDSEQSQNKIRSLSIYFPNVYLDQNSNEKTNIIGKNAADDQISKLTGINLSNFEEYFVEVEKTNSFQQQPENLLINQDQSQTGVKGDQSSNLMKGQLQPNSLNKNQAVNQTNSSENNNLQHQKRKTSHEELQESVNNLDKNYAWVQLEIIAMDIGSLLKLNACIVSIEEIDRVGKPNVFYYNIVVSRNDGLTYLVKRRYKQFRDLKNNLQKNIKKVEYVSFPSRSISKITSLFSKKSYLNYLELAQQRKDKLQQFLNFITDLDEVYKEESFIQFFTSGGLLDSEIKSPQL